MAASASQNTASRLATSSWKRSSSERRRAVPSAKRGDVRDAVGELHRSFVEPIARRPGDHHDAAEPVGMPPQGRHEGRARLAHDPDLARHLRHDLLVDREGFVVADQERRRQVGRACRRSRRGAGRDRARSRAAARRGSRRSPRRARRRPRPRTASTRGSSRSPPARCRRRSVGRPGAATARAAPSRCAPPRVRPRAASRSRTPLPHAGRAPRPPADRARRTSRSRGSTARSRRSPGRRPWWAPAASTR